MARGGFKDLARRTDPNILLYDKAFNIEMNPNYDGYHQELTPMTQKFLGKKLKTKGALNQKLADELQRLY